MQLNCPSCHTAFRLDPSALGVAGRNVRCARCKTTWFARQEDVVPMTAAQHGELLQSAAGEAPAIVLPKVVPWNDTVMVEINSSPSLVPAGSGEVSTGVESRPRAERGRAALGARRPASQPSRTQRQAIAAVAVFGALLFAAYGLRANIVRAIPDLAGFYAAIGLPVNLRGIEFASVKTIHEVQDGIPVLVIEGEVTNVTRQPVEVPRLRFAVLGADARELYAWTALLPRSVLPEGETVPFRSRLASPPADGKEIMVRFLNRFDLSANGR
jgi:predicted Zn finger-like uncharacterized protein